MQAVVLTPHPPKHVRLEVESFDSGPECSFAHMVEVRTLVDDWELPLEMQDAETLPEIEATAWN